MIDFRSDTVTKPTDAMKQAMFAASVGDDVFGEDPTIIELERYAASIFGKEAGLFCPSGTMTNQIGIRVHTQMGDEVICEKSAHVYKYEGGGIAVNALCSVKLLEGQNGILEASQFAQALNNPNDPHFPLSRLVCLENTSNGGGGSVYPKKNLESISAFCQAQKLGLHLDGARVFNALAVADYDAETLGSYFDSISICLSKGLGAPVGSVLLGTQDFVSKARRIRKVLGGGMRQAGFLAAAGLYALTHHRDRLVEDHIGIQKISETVENLPWVTGMIKPETNILLFYTEKPAQHYVDALRERSVSCLAVGQHTIRLVGHLDIAPNDYDFTIQQLLEIKV